MDTSSTRPTAPDKAAGTQDPRLRKRLQDELQNRNADAPPIAAADAQAPRADEAVLIAQADPAAAAPEGAAAAGAAGGAAAGEASSIGGAGAPIAAAAAGGLGGGTAA